MRQARKKKKGGSQKKLRNLHLGGEMRPEKNCHFSISPKKEGMQICIKLRGKIREKSRCFCLGTKKQELPVGKEHEESHPPMREEGNE